MCTSKNFYVERCYCNSPLEYREWLKKIQENKNFERDRTTNNCCFCWIPLAVIENRRQVEEEA
jgi:hypothetical protein